MEFNVALNIWEFYAQSNYCTHFSIDGSLGFSSFHIPPSLSCLADHPLYLLKLFYFQYRPQ